ncbi:MAG: DUF1326 domain-containing protein [Spirochaetales bacterium]|nr:DUF1326 domain-containing protein [Spirochaetales bacterium]
MAWHIKGTWNESCASEGHCSFQFGRDREEPCKQWVLFQIEEGEIEEVDVAGTFVVTVADIYSNKISELFSKGAEGAIYISDNTTFEQRKVMEPFFVNNVMGHSLIKKLLGVKYVNMELSEKGTTTHLKMPYGEWEASLTLGRDGKNPMRIENGVFSDLFPVVDICNTHFWNYHDFGKNWDFKDRSGARADFDLKSK